MDIELQMDRDLDNDKEYELLFNKLGHIKNNIIKLSEEISNKN